MLIESDRRGSCDRFGSISMSVKTRLPWRMEFARQLPQDRTGLVIQTKPTQVGFKFFESA
ncbi:hypothetical protein [Nostoc sp.]|uniref:hypothetical protein n=1 Tax=Nostoc sp. TaxID=1180 RepID=UPI002FF648A5